MLFLFITLSIHIIFQHLVINAFLIILKFMLVLICFLSFFLILQLVLHYLEIHLFFLLVLSTFFELLRNQLLIKVIHTLFKIDQELHHLMFLLTTHINAHLKLFSKFISSYPINSTF